MTEGQIIKFLKEGREKFDKNDVKTVDETTKRQIEFVSFFPEDSVCHVDNIKYFPDKIWIEYMFDRITLKEAVQIISNLK
jgi:hypothetical protein